MIYTLLRTTKRIIKQCIGFSYPNNTLNIYKTLLFNILCFGLKDGLKFPILIYGPIKLCIIGTIKIHTPIRKGLVTIGKESFKTYNPSKFLNSGIIEIYGPVTIAGGCIIENYGTIVCKGYNRISDNCMILIREKLTIGEQTSIGFHSHIMDSDDHFTINVLTGDIHKNTAPILWKSWCGRPKVWENCPSSSSSHRTPPATAKTCTAKTGLSRFSARFPGWKT